MHFLLSNDDGYQAQGIAILAEYLAKLGKVTVVAPDRNRSGASNSLTLDIPLHVKTAVNGFIFVNGTPTDCVHLAITGLLDSEPDMVVSGINAGPNLGDDVLYSGTVAAAMEGRYLGRTGIAISLAGDPPTHYDSAAIVASCLIRNIISAPFTSESLLNVNVPDLPFVKIRGMEVTRLGQRHKSKPAIKMSDPRNNPIYWVGPSGEGADAGPGTDFFALANDRVSITPLQYDMTRYSALETLDHWVKGVSWR
ncbi:MAG: 5'/3'-nucleotidase SurE [Gammaproteobacteria bacterium]|jgi:5'-nucleotidase|nr:MAG: 5'/3'-nucleotidase SurE [Gammaproteobacteria bacterium]